MHEGSKEKKKRRKTCSWTSVMKTGRKSVMSRSQRGSGWQERKTERTNERTSSSIIMNERMDESAFVH